MFITACVSADLSVVIDLDIGAENTVLSYAHSFLLQSPTFPAPHSETCLVLEYTSMVKFTVKRACMAADKVSMDVLRWSSEPLGFELHRMNLDIQGTDVDYEKCLLMFDILATKSGLQAAISSVTLTEGICVYPGLSLFTIYCI